MSSEPKLKLIVNPNADLGRAWQVAGNLRPVVEEFGGADWAGTVYPGHAVELARLAAEAGHPIVVAAGGDGTAHEVANGLMQVPAERRPRMGIVPIGSGNDFSHAVGMDASPYTALRQIFTGKARPIDVGLLTDGHNRREFWVNTMGIGFDATATIRSRRFTAVRGFVIYLLAVLQTILWNHDAPTMDIQTDQESWAERMLMLVLCNGPREGGGFYVQPAARPDDGILHYASVGKVSRLMMLRILPEVMRGTHGKMKAVRMGQFKSLHLKADAPLYIHTDGEIFAGFGTDVHELQVDILPGALEIVR